MHSPTYRPTSPTYLYRLRIFCVPKSEVLLPYVSITSLPHRANAYRGSAAGSVCTNDGQCQSSSSPPPPPPPPPPPSLDPPPPEGQYRTTSTDAYTSATTTDAYSGVTSTNAYNGATSTDTYNDGTSIHDNPTVPSAYTSPTSTTTTSRSTTSRSSSSFAVANAQTTDGGNGPPTSSAEKTTLGYSITGVMFLVVVAGLV